MLRRYFTLTLALCTLGLGSLFAQDSWQLQAGRLASLLHWHPGSVVAEIGAGDGELTLLAAERVGPSGRVYSTELKTRLPHRKKVTAQQRNVTVVEAAQAATNLPPACCDSIFLRTVYHHFTKPAEIDASIFQSLKPGGRLAVIDREPPPGSALPEGVPKNRGGHGMPQKLLISELTAAGFSVEEVVNDWPGLSESYKTYCVVFRKPEASR